MEMKEYSDDPLSSEELQQLRLILEKEKHWKWLARASRDLAMYISVCIAGVLLFWDTFVSIIRSIAK